HEPRADRRVNDLFPKLRSGEIVETLPSAVAGNDVFGIDSAELGNSLPDVIVVKGWHDVEPADHGEHLVYARNRHCGAYCVDHSAMTTGGEHDQPTSPDVVYGGYFVIKLIRNVSACILFRRH